ncbi:hypothetical protein K449DRAFT_453592 [Hypoxylon sp. EC38]|nr:hypothetical protein K449DRAFT_453592 [Hypoxylon sp. EC38]
MATLKEEVDALLTKCGALLTIGKAVYEKLEGDDVTEDNMNTVIDKMKDFNSSGERCQSLFRDIIDSDFEKEIGDLYSWPDGWEETKDKVGELSTLTGIMDSIQTECLNILGSEVL